MALNNTMRRSLQLMQELTELPFRTAQELWSNSPGEQSSTAGRTVNRSLDVLGQLSSIPFQFALEFFEPQGRAQSNSMSGRKSQTHSPGQLLDDGNTEEHFAPRSEH